MNSNFIFMSIFFDYSSHLIKLIKKTLYDYQPYMCKKNLLNSEYIKNQKIYYPAHSSVESCMFMYVHEGS
jgi:hypothetical protein